VAHCQRTCNARFQDRSSWSTVFEQAFKLAEVVDRLIQRCIAILVFNLCIRAGLKRCRGFKEKPPADNWDGVFSLTMK
jgi:hypothetical protein